EIAERTSNRLSHCFFFSSRRRHTRCLSDWSSDVCSSDLFDLIGGGNKTSSATLFITLKPWDERRASAEDIVKFVGAKGTAVSERSEERRVGKEGRWGGWMEC